MSSTSNRALRSRTVTLLATASALTIIAMAGSAQAGPTVINGVTDTVPGAFASPFNVDGGLQIGTTGTGELDVTAGGGVTVTNCFYAEAGVGAAGVGTLKIDGAGATFNNGTCGALIGEGGSGTLSITNGAVFTTSSTNAVGSAIADLLHSTGAVTINGAGSTWNFAGLVVGNLGTGTLTVSGGGTLNQASCSAVDLGNGAKGNGTITVTGAGSKWTNTCAGPGNLLNVGDDGVGTINVTAGGVAHVGQSVFAGFSDGAGNLLVSGAGSQFLSNNQMTMGQGGVAQMSILAGGLVTDSGASVGGLNSVATVDGVGSTWTNTGSLIINSASAALVISNGGLVTSATGSDGGFVSIGGAGSQWTIAGGLGGGMNIGSVIAGSGVLNLTAGGVLSDNTGSAAVSSHSFATISIDGAGTSWNNSTTTDFGAGFQSTFNMTITNGGALVDTTGDLETGVVTIHNAGSTWTSSGNLTAGNGGVASIDLYGGGVVSVGGGAGTLFLGGNGFGLGALNIGGTLNPAQTPGALLAATVNLRTANSNVDFHHSSSGYIFAPAIIGIGQLDNQTGVTILTGASTYTGATTVQGGTLLVDGSLGATTVFVTTGGSFGGSGSVAGTVSLGTNGHLLGVAGQTLTAGTLFLAPGADMDISLGAPSTAPLFQVNGAVTLDGTVNVADAGGFGPGLYRLIDYTGALTDNGLVVGTTPAGVLASALTVQTSVPGEVNLLYGPAVQTQFWNGSTLAPTGTVVGGAGTWKLGPTNWTDATGTASGAWPGAFAIFMGTPGVVTVDNSGGAVTATGMQFFVGGYTVSGGTLTLTGASPGIQVGDGTPANVGAAVINSVIAGSGFSKTDNGRLVLNGVNTFAGAVNIVAGTLAVGADDNLGAAANTLFFSGGAQPGSLETTAGFSSNRAVDFIGSGALVVDSGTTLTLTGAVTGGATFYKGGSGILALTGASSFNGSIDELAGGLLVGGSISTAGLTVNSGATLGGSGSIGGPVAILNGGVIAGSAGQTLTTGSLTLNTTSIVDVTLGAPSTAQLFQVNGALTLAGSLNVTDGGGFGLGLYRLIDYTGALTNNGLIIGNIPNGVAATNLSVQTSVAGQVNLIYAASPLQFWNGSTFDPTGSVVGGVGYWQLGPTNWTDAAGAASAAWGGVDAVFAAGPATVTINNGPGVVNANFLQFAVGGYSVGGGTLTLTGAAPTIRVGDGTAAGAAYIATISSVIAGSGGLTKTDLGALILSGNNTFTGGLILNGGLLGVSADANLGDPTNGLLFTGGGLAATSSFTSHRLFDFSGAGGIATGSGVTLTLTNALSGAGALAKTGTGVLDLTGASSYNGALSLNGGILQLDGSIAGTIAVGNGAKLKGIGAAGATTINSGGVLAPGNTAGALSVTGALTFQPGSSYVVGITPQGQSDQVDATGVAAINGGVVTVLSAPGPYALGDHYTIITSGSSSGGGFSGLVQNLNQPFLQLTLVYAAKDVFLNVTRNGASFCSVAVTKNQCAAAGGAESLGVANPLYDAVANSPSAASAQGAFDALSGEVHASFRGVEIEDSRFLRDAALERLDQAHPAPGEGRATWGQVFAAQGGVNGDGNAASLTRTVGGFLMGADTPADADWRIGVLAGYSQTRFAVGARASSGSSDDYHLGAYAGLQGGPVKARFGATYTWRDISTSRGVAFPGFAEVDKGSARSGAAQVFGELAYPLGGPNHAIEPFAGAALVALHSDGFAETGGAAALRADTSSTRTSFATAGLRASETWTLGGGASVSLRGSVAWRGAYGEPSQGAHLTLSPGGSAFDVYGAPIAKDAMVVDLAVSARLSAAARLSLGYVGQTSATAHDDGVQAGLKVSF